MFKKQNQKTKPFNLEEAKRGAKLITRDCENTIRILTYDSVSDYPIVGLVQDRLPNGYVTDEYPEAWDLSGRTSSNEDGDDDIMILITDDGCSGNPEPGDTTPVVKTQNASFNNTAVMKTPDDSFVEKCIVSIMPLLIEKGIHSGEVQGNFKNALKSYIKTMIDAKREIISENK